MKLLHMTSRTKRLAYRLLRLADATQKRLDHLAQKYTQVTPERIKQLDSADPTNGQFLEWLIRQDLDPTTDVGEDMPKLRELLKIYAKIKSSPDLLTAYELSPDINKYRIGYLAGKLMPIYYGQENLESRAEKLKRAKTMARVIYDEPPYKVIKIEAGETPEGLELAAEASCQYAKNTKWCTSEMTKAKGYLQRGPLFIVFKGNEKILQTDGREFKNAVNEDIKWTDEIIMVLLDSGFMQMQAERLKRDKMMDLFVYNLDIDIHKFPKATQYLIDHGMVSAEGLLTYAEMRSLPRWPEAEPVIMQNPKIAASYAKYILGRRWHEAESVIQQNPKAWDNYQTYFTEAF